MKHFLLLPLFIIVTSSEADVLPSDNEYTKFSNSLNRCKSDEKKRICVFLDKVFSDEEMDNIRKMPSLNAEQRTGIKVGIFVMKQESVNIAKEFIGEALRNFATENWSTEVPIHMLIMVTVHGHKVRCNLYPYPEDKFTIPIAEYMDICISQNKYASPKNYIMNLLTEIENVPLPYGSFRRRRGA